MQSLTLQVVAALNFWVTYISFWATDLDLRNIFAAVSGFLATVCCSFQGIHIFSKVPIFGTWMLWVPASLYLGFVQQRIFAAIAVAVSHFVTTFVIQPWIYTVFLALVLADFFLSGSLVTPITCRSQLCSELARLVFPV